MADIFSFLLVVLRMSTPVLYATLGVLFMHMSGVMNIGAEGMMLMGAFAGATGTYFFGNVWLGSLFALVVSAGVGALFAFFTVTLKANQTVVGVAFNILATGLTTALYRVLFGMSDAPKLEGFKKMAGGLSLPVYLGLLLVGLLTVFFYKTLPGLKIRSAGEHPKAVDTVGLSVSGIRYASTIVGAMLIGFGGTFLSMGQLSFFTESMTTGRGYIALAAVILGRYHPVGCLLAVWVFGFGEAITYKLQAIGSTIPANLILMIPYIITIFAVAGFGKNMNEPTALGKPYIKSK